MKLGQMIVGWVDDVPVRGEWSGRGMWVREICDGKPLDIAFAYRELTEGRLSEHGWIEPGGEYLLDD